LKLNEAITPMTIIVCRKYDWQKWAIIGFSRNTLCTIIPPTIHIHRRHAGKYDIKEGRENSRYKL